jgi:hypothetical protein
VRPAGSPVMCSPEMLTRWYWGGKSPRPASWSRRVRREAARPTSSWQGRPGLPAGRRPEARLRLRWTPDTSVSSCRSCSIGKCGT